MLQQFFEPQIPNRGPQFHPGSQSLFKGSLHLIHLYEHLGVFPLPRKLQILKNKDKYILSSTMPGTEMFIKCTLSA